MSEYDLDTGELVPIEEVQHLPVASPVMRPLASPEVTQVCTALAKAQGAFEAPTRTKTARLEGTSRSGHAYAYEYKYAPLEEIVRVVQKPLSENGLSRQQYLVNREGNWFVRTIIWHLSGEWISSDYPVFAEQMTAQKFASGVTYAKRQGLSLALGLAPEDDDDAAVADALPPASAAATATRAAPAKQQSTPDQDRAREAFRRLRSEIEDTRSPAGLRDIWEAETGWHPRLKTDVDLVTSAPNGLGALKTLTDFIKGKMQEEYAGG